MKNKFYILLAVAAIAIGVTACSFSTAKLSSLKVSNQKGGATDTSSFKAGETIYADAVVANSMSKTTVKYSLVVDEAPGKKKGDVMTGSEVKVELPSSGTASYSLPIPSVFQGGKFTLVADMLNEAGEKKDSKSTPITIAAGAAPAAPADTDEDKDDDKDGHK